MFPVVTRDLALRVEKSEADHMNSWMLALQSQPANPFGIEISRFGGATAFFNYELSLGPLFNRVMNFGDEESTYLTQIVRFYNERHSGCRIDVNPYHGRSSVFVALDESGFHPVRFHNAMYAPASIADTPPPRPAPRDVVVRQLNPAQIEVWAQTWHRSFTDVLNAAPNMTTPLAKATSQLCGRAGWRLYMAYVEGAPAAAAGLYVQDRVGSLVMGGCLPEFQNRGCQTALIYARIKDAQSLGCDLVTAQSALGSTSQHNLERAGLRIAYTRAFWWHP